MRKAKDLALIGVYTALLLGGQFALASLSGIEIVTLLVFVFAFSFGVRRSLILVVAFSFLRCFLFGFFPSVLILYLIYYPIFVTIMGLLGNRFKHKLTPKRHVLVIIVAVILTVFFSLLDSVITPLYYGFSTLEWKGYLASSLYAMIPQVICVGATMMGARVILKAMERLQN